MGGLKTISSYFSVGATREYFQRLVRCFTLKFVLMCGSVYFGLKGIVENYVYGVEAPYYSIVGLEGRYLNINSAISFAPWTMKGFIALFADNLPLFGYQKRFYMILTTMFALVSLSVLSVLPFEWVNQVPYLAALLLFAVGFQVACHDLLCQGKYVEFMRVHPEAKGDIWTFVYIAGALGGFVPAVTIGIVSQYFDVRYVFVFMIVFDGQSLCFTLSGCMVNDAVAPERSNRLDTEKIKREARPMTLLLLMSLSTVGVVAVAIMGNSTIQFVYGMGVSLVMAAIVFWALPFMVAKANLFIFLIEVLYVNIAGAVDYYYTATPDCVENGPHFSWLYYRTWTTTIGAFSGIVGIYLFQVVLTKYTYRQVFVSTTIFRAFASCFDIIIMTRTNVAIGIPDEFMFLLGSTIIYRATWMMNVVPISMIMSKLCPKTIEVTIFAVLAGFANQGLNIARFVGVFFMDLLSIKTLNDHLGPCNYDNIVWLVLISHVICPLTCVFFAIWLVPNVQIAQNLLQESEQTTGFSSLKIASENTKNNPSKAVAV